MIPWSVLPIAAWLVACGGAPGTPAAPSAGADEPHGRWTGTLAFEARTPTPTGASEARTEKPARHVRLIAQDHEGATLARTATDDLGRFVLDAPLRAARLVVAARIEHEGIDLSIARDALGREVHAAVVELGPPREGIDVVFGDDDAAGFGGALHILDTELRGVVAARTWTREPLPPLYTHWGRGVTTTWSYYHGERPAGSGRFALELLGGQPSLQSTTDTDEHDEAIILHEVGHFVMDRLTSHSSAGGDHPTGHLLDPGLAWEEGRASWFAAAVLGAPLYWDTIGIEPGGSLRVSHDLERGMPGPRGLGSEQGVAEILWDLSDGGGGLPDQDADGVALGPARVLEAMREHGREDGVFPSIGSFLAYLVSHGDVTLEAMKQVLVVGGHPVSTLFQAGDAGWPSALAVPGSVTDKIDGLSSPAPSGGPNRPENGFDAMDVYRVRIERPTWLFARLTIFGTGKARDHQDLDIELRDQRAEVLDSSRAEDPREVVSHRVEPGTYLVYVRDGGSGNRAGYSLDVWTE
jgi:hypothetical protein